MSKSAIDCPMLRTYDRDHLAKIAMPVGGIGTGTISIGGRGNLQDFEIVNRPAKGFTPRNTLFALYAKPAGGEAVVRALEGPIPPAGYEAGFGCAVPNHGWPRFRECAFESSYPFGRVLLRDKDVPLDVEIEAFNPLIPGDADASGIPLMVLRFVLKNKTGRKVSASVCGSLENFIGSDGSGGKPIKNRNEFRKRRALQGLFMHSTGVDRAAEQFGTMALSTTARSGVSHRTAWAQLNWGDSLLDFHDDFSADGTLEDRDLGDQDAPVASLAVSVNLPARATREVTFLVTWHFPNRMTWSPRKKTELPVAEGCCTGGECGPQGNPDCIGNYYTAQYADAWEVAEKTAPRLATLEAKSKAFVRAFVGSDLPDVVKEAALFNLSTLRSQTCFRTPDGRFFGWEGCGDKSGCCDGSCTHVWNYEQATAFLFGSLSRTMREVEFLYATDPKTGHMCFRTHLPLSRARGWLLAAADGQMGTIIKLYRDWQLSGDEVLLRSLWPNARKALEFCWIDGGWDADRDGVMEGCQHNTMDVEYFGPNPQMTVMYLAALRSAERMARHLGETDFADECARLAEQGGTWVDENLFNGEYYEHRIAPMTDPKGIAPGLRHEHMGARDPARPELQIGPGCEVNQLFGQQLAHVAGLGRLLDRKKIQASLRATMKHNFRTSLAGHFNHLRSYALNDEAGLLMCTWPRGGRPARPFPYANEVWTGLEYMLAALLVEEGMTRDALKIVNAARARHDGQKRNPFDEPECGHHYARAMASWAMVPAMTGFRYSAVEGTITFAATQKPSTSFWSTGDAWGTLRQKRNGKQVEAELTVLHGRVRLNRLQLTGAGAAEIAGAKTLTAGKTLRMKITGKKDSLLRSD